MTMDNPPGDRREHYRFSLRDYVFASLNPNSHVLGRIVDISEHGLAFCYPATEKQTDASSSLTITWGDAASRIEGIPFKIAWDNVLPGNASLGAMIRHCGVRFVGLTEDQKAFLERLIQGQTDTNDPKN